MLSSLGDAYLRYLGENLRGLQVFRCDILGILVIRDERDSGKPRGAISFVVVM